ncbi:hypothetical protein BH23ACT12_BH23ACT12_15280 [soil metagenome]
MSELTMSPLSAPAGFFAVASVGDVPSGWVLRTSAGGRDIALSNIDGVFYALDNSCTHAGGPLAPNHLSPACTLECPWHNAVFDARNGEVIAGPARKSAKTYPVQVHDEMVYVSVDTTKPAPVPTGPPPSASTDG